MFKKIVKIGVLVAILNALYQVLPPYWRHQQFTSQLQDLALRSKGKPDNAILDAVMELAAEHRIAIEREWVTVSRAPDLSHTYIDATWAETLRPFPGWQYTWVPKVRVDGWHVRAPVGDVR